MDDKPQLTLQDIIGILRRRWLLILPIFFLVASVSALVAMVLPPVYQSTGVILVESQQIPVDLVRATVTSLAGERIEVIKRRVMTRDNLWRVIEKYGLFLAERDTISTSRLIDQMRNLIEVELITADTGSRRNRATIAFKVSFSHGRPEFAHKVANELVTLFLEENIKTRTARASETTDFLAHEAEKLKQQLERTENQIAGYKQKHGNALPEHMELHMAMLDRAKSEYKETDREIKAAKEEKRFLEVQLAAARSGSTAAAAAAVNSTVVKSPSQELAELRDELTALSVHYQPVHPDVRALMRKIRALEEEIAGGPDKDRLREQLVTSQVEYADLRRRYGPNHREAERLRQEIAGLQQQINDLAPLDTLAPQDSGESSSSPRQSLSAIDPFEAAVMEKIGSTDARIESLEAQNKEQAQQIDELEEIIIQTPQVERGLTSLSRDYENALRKYEETRAKQMEAQFAESLEEEEKAERFTLLEPPLLPERPVKPNRLKILGIGAFLAVASGGGSAILAEMLDQSVRGAQKLAALLKQPPIAVIPYLFTTEELQRRRWRRIALFLLFVAVFVAIILGVHISYMPLDVISVKVMQRFGLG